jgi:hypothetical protein
MTGRSKALDRLWAHEHRRHGRSERTAIRNLSGRELIRLIRSLNQVDRAVAAYRRTQNEEQAA